MLQVNDEPAVGKRTDTVNVENVDVQAGVAFALSTNRWQLINKCIGDVQRGEYKAAAPSYISLLKVVRHLMLCLDRSEKMRDGLQDKVSAYRSTTKRIQQAILSELDDLDPDFIEEDAHDDDVPSPETDDYGSVSND